MTTETVFHKILAKQIPATVVFEDDEVLAFLDIHPKAKTHVLFVPKVFAESVSSVGNGTEHLPGMLILKAKAFAEEKGIAGYKLLFNVGKEGGQEVPYIHLHFMSEQAL